MSTATYTGSSQGNTWSDPTNWSGHVPGSTDRALLSGNGTHTFTGPLSAGTIMLLGTETVTFNGTVSAYDSGFCAGIMVCNGGVMNFNPGSTLNDAAGALLIGNAATGHFTAYGTIQQATTINSANATVGKLAGHGVGVITIDGATWNNADVAFIGFDGDGTLDVRDGGVANIHGNLSVAGGTQSTGHVIVEAGSTVNVGGSSGLGTARADQTAGGNATVTVNAGGTLNIGHWMFEGPTSALVLNGGTVTFGTSGQGWLVLQAGGVVIGHGVMSSVSSVLLNAGTITAQGGTLEIGSNVSGAGVLDIAANSTAKLDGAAVQASLIDFTGAGGTLEFKNTPWVPGPIKDFAAGDRIVFDSMVDSVKWQASTGTLTMLGGGHAVDTLHLGGMAANAAFDLQHSAGTSIITLHG